MRIELLGASFQIQSDESPEYIERILAHYTERVGEIEATVATGDPLKKAILAALLVTDELFRERERGRSSDSLAPEDAEEIERITTRPIEHIDSTLPDSED